MIGKTLGHYRVVDQIGAGGMGVVWKAIDTRLNREVALKVLPADQIQDPERQRRFAREARAASALNHPNIITIYEIDCEGEIDFIAMEFVRGRSLLDLLRAGPVSYAHAVSYAIQIADALSKAHLAGIIHRDIKPANIMVNDDGLVKVLDFGIAKLRSLDTDPSGSTGDDPTGTITLTRAGRAFGTFSYMSPEQALGDEVDQRSDIFSFGVVLYEILSGARPFQANSNLEAMRSLLSAPPPPLRNVARRVPGQMIRISDKCLAKDPAQRYQQSSELLRDLRALPAPEVSRARSTSKSVWIAGAALLLLLAAFLLPA